LVFKGLKSYIIKMGRPGVCFGERQGECGSERCWNNRTGSVNTPWSTSLGWGTVMCSWKLC